MSYKKHLFICTRCKKDESGNPMGEKLFQQVKGGLDKSELKSKSYRLSSSGCMGLCAKGINAVVYPEGKHLHFLDAEESSVETICQELKS